MKIDPSNLDLQAITVVNGIAQKSPFLNGNYLSHNQLQARGWTHNQMFRHMPRIDKTSTSTNVEDGSLYEVTRVAAVEAAVETIRTQVVAQAKRAGPAPTTRGQKRAGQAIFTKLPDGTWGIRVPLGTKHGATVTVVKRSGKTRDVHVGDVVLETEKHLFTKFRSVRRAAETPPAAPVYPPLIVIGDQAGPGACDKCGFKSQGRAFDSVSAGLVGAVCITCWRKGGAGRRWWAL